MLGGRMLGGRMLGGRMLGGRMLGGPWPGGWYLGSVAEKAVYGSGDEALSRGLGRPT